MLTGRKMKSVGCWSLCQYQGSDDANLVLGSLDTISNYSDKSYSTLKVIQQVLTITPFSTEAVEGPVQSQ